jgi:hypothetical protein
MPNVKLTKSAEHVEKLLERVRNAHERGLAGKRDYWMRAYLNSDDAKILAVRRADQQTALPFADNCTKSLRIFPIRRQVAFNRRPELLHDYPASAARGRA